MNILPSHHFTVPVSIYFLFTFCLNILYFHVFLIYRDDDLFEDGGERPLTRSELKTVVMKMWHGISVPDHQNKTSGKRPKAKSPGPEIKQ